MIFSHFDNLGNKFLKQSISKPIGIMNLYKFIPARTLQQQKNLPIPQSRINNLNIVN